jgi:hypothetical protein
MLFLDLLGATLPRGLIYLFNPVAWLGNVIGVSGLVGGVLRGMDEAVGEVGSFVGMPVVGSLAIWFLLGWFRWRRPEIVFFLLVVPWFLAMQLTTKRGYESLAEHFQARGRDELEADALSKAMYIIEASQVDDPGATRLAARLRELE